jgi:hypothetical protein
MLFKSIADLQQVLPFTENFEFEKISPSLLNAEMDYLIPIIGQEQYDELNDAYVAADSEDDLFPALKKLLDYSQRVTANIGMYNYTPKGNLNIGKSGFTVTESGTDKIASQWRIEDFKSSILNDYHKACENMLLMMETNATDYPLWTESDSYSLYKDGFINTAKDFQNYVDISESRLMFLKFIPTMKRLELSNIQTVIGTGLFDQIKTQIKERTVSSFNRKLLQFINRALANLTVGDALRLCTVKWTDNGLQLISTSSSMTQVNESTMEMDRMEAIRKQFIDIGLKAQLELRNYLYANAEDYPLFLNDPTVYQPTVSVKVENDRNNSTFFA